jgi:hypothetical protein
LLGVLEALLVLVLGVQGLEALLALVLGVQGLEALLALLGSQWAKSFEDVVGYFPLEVLEQEDWVCVLG